MFRGHGLQFAVATAFAAHGSAAALGADQLRIKHVQMKPQAIPLVLGLHHFIPSLIPKISAKILSFMPPTAYLKPSPDSNLPEEPKVAMWRV